jgi:tRNA-Thr(GGU) m(6)t(6)A37 methyltransferase TsaA
VTCDPIGTVHNGVDEPLDDLWHTVVSEIRLRPRWAPGLRGLDAFSHVLVVFVMHEAAFVPADHLVRHPRERADLPLLGIFAQRARHRPNRLGVTVCPIDRIEGGSVYVRGLDAMDGTPVLDLKPHVPAFDAPASPRVPDWIRSLHEPLRPR